MIVDLEPSVDEDYLLAGLEEEKILKPKTKVKKTLLKRVSKEVVQEPTWGDEKISMTSST